MAVRIRKDRKTIICAAKSKPEEGDCYLDDDVHYTLAVEMKILRSHRNEGDTWYFRVEAKPSNKKAEEK